MISKDGGNGMGIFEAFRENIENDSKNYNKTKRTEENIKEFDLNIEKILENWEKYHAIREIIANALDEQVLTNSQEIEIKKTNDGWWHIRDYGRGINYHHLTQNENEKN